MFIGAGIVTFALTRITNWILKKKLLHRTAAITSFVIGVLFILLTRSRRMEIQEVFTGYVPWLTVWLVMDLVKSSSSKINCPFCGENIKKVAIICKHCKKDLRVAPTE